MLHYDNLNYISIFTHFFLENEELDNKIQILSDMTENLNNKLNELQNKHESLKVNFEKFKEHSKKFEKLVLGLFTNLLVYLYSNFMKNKTI